jgi:alanine racemase
VTHDAWDRRARPTGIDVDLDAIEHNVRVLQAHVAPAAIWVVVKADGYGHGAVPVSRAAVAAGAEGLGVALVEEGEALRAGAIDSPVLLLSEPPLDAVDRVVAARLEPAVYSHARLAALGEAVARAGVAPLPVHLKVDTGMHRVGATPDAAPELARLVDAHPGLELASVWTHLAVADEPASTYTDEQLDRFDRTVNAIGQAGIDVRCVHAANSAGAIAHRRGHLDRVRVGIAAYGIAPSPALRGAVDLRPALRLVSEVSHVQHLGAGETVSYGRRFTTERDTTIATVPIGYADGVRRALGALGGEVPIGGRRRRIAGTVTMDQITVDCGSDDVARGDEVVLIGRQGDEEITVDEWADLLDTIGYEITCGFTARVPRRMIRSRAHR